MADIERQRIDEQRQRMVARQIRDRGIGSPAILAAFEAVPRHAFVPSHLADDAYGDEPLPIGEGQTISQPYIVARMIEAARIGPHDRVLEVGAGSGYAAAILSRIAKAVFAVERHHTLADQAAERLHESYSLVRTITWAVPILGFLGTVVGITMAIANVTPEQLDTSLGEVTDGLAVAFDTTARPAPAPRRTALAASPPARARR